MDINDIKPKVVGDRLLNEEFNALVDGVKKNALDIGGVAGSFQGDVIPSFIFTNAPKGIYAPLVSGIYGAPTVEEGGVEVNLETYPLTELVWNGSYLSKKAEVEIVVPPAINKILDWLPGTFFGGSNPDQRMNNGQIWTVKPEVVSTTQEPVIGATDWEEKLNFARTFIRTIYGKNRFDKSTVIPDMYVNYTNGNLNPSVTYDASDYIFIGDLDEITIYSFVHGAWYDSDKVWTGEQITTGGGLSTLTIPAGAEYIRVSVQKAIIDEMQVESGTERTSYESYVTPVTAIVLDPNIKVDTFLEKSIGVESTNFAEKKFVGGKNLFNKNDVVNGMYVNWNNGNLLPNASYSTSDFIPVLPNSNYALTSLPYYAIYDADKVFISGGTGITTFNSGVNGYFIRVSSNTALLDSAQLEQGTAQTSYEEYKPLVERIVIEDLYVPGSDVNTDLEVILPDKIHAVVGDTLQLFFRGMIKDIDPYQYDILVTCPKGNKYPRYFEYTPVLADVGTVNFNVKCKDKDGNIKGEKTCQLITRNAVKSPASEISLLPVGDSLTDLGIWVIEANRRLTGAGGTPAGLGLTNLAFKGRESGSGAGWEGNSGWTWTSYATAGVAANKFNVTGVTNVPSLNAVYTNNGKTFTVVEVNITAGIGYIRCLSTGAPTASGVLTKSAGGGDATINFSASTADSGNPFWNTGTNTLDFTSYVNTYMDGAVDAIYFLLTWNGQTPNRESFGNMIATAKILIDHIHAAYPNCKIKIMGVQVPSVSGGMGYNYGASGTSYADQFGMVKTALNMNKAYQDWCNEAAYSSFMEFVNVSTQFDSENNMPSAETPVNTRSIKTEERGTNGVHPNADGYNQIADVVFRNIVANYCQ